MDYELSSTCSGCGQPKSKAWDPDTAGSWEQHHIQCYACQAKEDAERTSSSDTRESGQLTYMTLNAEDVERARRRREFMEANPDFDFDSIE